ncbi:MAG: calcium/sodium antiporter, partial [Gammaproteobacteria bacterium]|nr:calcium/sodium antiporter [Gammaproteobacteria bacterium]
TSAALAWLTFGLVLLLGGSRLLVTGAVAIATTFGVSDLVIGLTIVAIGTSLPELAASVASALKGAPEIALGNVVGSNMFNALGVLAMPALICPTTFGPELLSRDVLVMFGLSIALVVMAVSRRGHGEINRFEGGLLVAAFLGYQYLLFAEGG